jgi:competence protein ComEC
MFEASIAPILVYYFGTVSFVAPFANIFILPVVPVIMLLGFVAALVGVLVPSTAFVLMQPVAWVVSLVVRMITAFAHVPHASEHFVLDASVVLTTYIGLLVIAFVMMRRGSKMIAKRL